MGTVVRENAKVYIEGVRKISWDTGEMSEFASSVVSALNSLGEQIPYTFVMGVSGSAFRATINPGEWDFGNYSVRNITADPYDPVRRSLAAVGYEASIYAKGNHQEDTARIVASIDRGVPVIAFGVVGPSDAVVIAGYDQDGDVLLGWSTYQDIPDDHTEPHDVTGYFRKTGWHDAMHAYLMIGSKVERPPVRAIYLDAFQSALHLLRTPQLESKATGLEGLKVWADEMNQAQYFPADDHDLVGWRYVSVAVNMTMLRDHCLAEPFLRQASADVPDFAPELSQAANCYAEVRRIVDEMSEIISDNFSEKAMQAIHDPQMRKAYAEGILRIRDAEAEAAGHLENLLARQGAWN